jgi:hypothetical protein
MEVLRAGGMVEAIACQENLKLNFIKSSLFP